MIMKARVRMSEGEKTKGTRKVESEVRVRVGLGSQR